MPKDLVTRKYQVPIDGAVKSLPAVTEVLRLAFPKPGLVKWMQEERDEAAVTVLRAWAKKGSIPTDPKVRAKAITTEFYARTSGAATRGTNVHKYLEAYVLGQPLPTIDPAEQGYCDAGIQFHEFHQGEVLASEMQVACNDWAGTLDLVKVIDGLPTIVDYKTAAKAYDGPPFPDHAAQLGAYSMCHLAQRGLEWIADDTMTTAKAAMVVRLYPDGSYDATRVDLEAAREAFVTVWELFSLLVDSGRLWA